jgi:hypothetical protein
MTNEFNYQEFPDCKELLKDLIHEGDVELLKLVHHHHKLVQKINSDLLSRPQKNKVLCEKEESKKIYYLI